MLSNVGHTIQKMINNTPVAITVNETTSVVVTNGGNVYQTGLIGGKIQQSFREVITNENIVGHVIDAKAVKDGVYILNSAGSVFEYDYNAGSCGPVVREVYTPDVCGGDKAIKIDSGNQHVVILTENHKVWGAGDNGEYQIVPQGQCKYDTAVEMIVTDTNLHNNNCCTSFSGTYNELECPIIPNCEKACNNLSCIKKELCGVHLGYINICNVELSPPCQIGIFSVPVFGDLNYVGYLCSDNKNSVSGAVTYTISRLYIKCGCFIGKFTTTDSCGCHVKEINISSTNEIIIFEADQCCSANTDTCGMSAILPYTGTAQICGKCGDCVIVNIDIPDCQLTLPSVHFDCECKTIVLNHYGCKSSLTVLCSGAITDLCESYGINIALDFEVSLDCCRPCKPKEELVLPQPCWAAAYAGGNISVLVDDCNRLYAFGSLHNVRNNKDLLRKSCLEELLSKTNASVTFPADQLNCSLKPHRTGCCGEKQCPTKGFKTDLNKFGIHLSFPPGCKDECNEANLNICDFLQSLKRCNDSITCDNTCEPCDRYIYLNVAGPCGCPCGTPDSGAIGSVTIFNRKSICKLVSQGCPDIVTVHADSETGVEFDLNRYCIDTTDVALDKILKLNLCVDGPNVNVYVDIDQPGGIKLMSCGKKCNVEFTVNASTETHQYILNYGSILDPVELTNLKYALSLDCYYPCPQYKNPFDTKITNTYLKGGDSVKFVVSNPKNIRQAVTADIPTVFRLNRRVIDIGIGDNNLTVLVGGLACPNELHVIGNNCHGELGLGTHESIVCWSQIDRCIFDCQVTDVFSGTNVTFYVTRSHSVYAAGQWKCLVNSTTPSVVKSICKSWKIKDMAISQNQILLLGSDGCVFGLGDNSLGELGLCNLECVRKPKPLVFFYKLNSTVTKQLSDGLRHPMEKNWYNNDNYNKVKCEADKYDKYDECGNEKSDGCGCGCSGEKKNGHKGQRGNHGGHGHGGHGGHGGYDDYSERPRGGPRYGPQRKYSQNSRIYVSKYGSNRYD